MKENGTAGPFSVNGLAGYQRNCTDTCECAAELCGRGMKTNDGVPELWRCVTKTHDGIPELWRSDTKTHDGIPELWGRDMETYYASPTHFHPSGE